MPRNEAMDLVGRRFGKLVVVELASRNPRQWRCTCDCGGEAAVNTSALTGGRQRSCGCMRRTLMRRADAGRFSVVCDPRYRGHGPLLKKCRLRNCTTAAFRNGRWYHVKDRLPRHRILVEPMDGGEGEAWSLDAVCYSLPQQWVTTRWQKAYVPTPEQIRAECEKILEERLRADRPRKDARVQNTRTHYRHCPEGEVDTE